MGLIVDSFAGGGGASTGIEMAGYCVDIAINHDPAAIAMHKANHPHTRHYCESVWDVDPREACGGQAVDLAWFSPDCKHFSKAKGAALVDKHIRGLAWIALRWAGTVRPSVIILENVEEFVTWGPVRKGKPIKARAGETFKKWLSQLKALGYAVEYRELLACDFGAPTSRKRFYLIARCDGQPIVWPEPTHGRPDTLEVHAGMLQPWRSAAEIIDWNLPCPSIFDTKQEIKEKYGCKAVRPLADATMKRVARGTDKFVIKNASPFLVGSNHTSNRTVYDCFRGGDVRKPYGTVTEKNGNGVIDPVMEPFKAPFQLHNHQNAVGTGIDSPVNTITTAGGCGQMIVAPSIVKYHKQESARGQIMDEPLRTVDTSGRFAINAAYMSEYYGNAQDGIRIDEPLHTVTAKDREALTVAHIEKYFSGGYKGCGSAADDPIGAITSRDHNAISLAHVMKYKGNDLGQHPKTPLHTLTATSGEFAAVQTRIEKYSPDCNMQRWPQVREMLNRFCGYSLAEDEVLLIYIRGGWWYIADIGLRMLTPREAFNAQGFPGAYIIEFDDQGKPYPKSEQMARCGNAVCPPVAAALVRANHPAARAAAA